MVHQKGNAPDRKEKIEQLLERARNGSSEALGQLLEACRGYLLGIANRQIESKFQAKGGASDLVQQSFLCAKEGLDGFVGSSEEELLAWLRRILLNNVANFRRQYQTDKRRVAREVWLVVGSSSRPLGEEIPADQASPSSLVAGDEQADMVARTLEKLPEEYRQVIELRYWRRFSFGEIGRQMNRTPNAVRKLWLRAIERLYREMEKPA